LAELSAIALAYDVVAALSLRFASINPSATPVWPLSGLALALVLLRGYRVWPAVFVGAVAANAPTVHWASLAVGTGNMFEALAGAWLVNRIAGGPAAFRSPTGVAWFAAIECAAATPISATLGVLSLALGGYAKISTLAGVWTTWWLGDFAGTVVVAPVVVLWATSPLRLERPYADLVQQAARIAFAAGIGLIAFGSFETTGALAFLAVLPPLWGALRGSERDTATAALVLSGFAIWGAASGGGPFARSPLNDSYLLLIAFMISVALPSLALAAGMASRGRALAASEDRYRLLVDAIRDYAVFMIDPKGRISTWNSGATRIYGYDAAATIGQPVAILEPDGETADTSALLQKAAETGAADVEAWRVRADGRRFWAHVLVSSIRDERGQLVGFAKITRDVSEQREAQAALELTREQLLQAQKLEALGQLTGGVAHDFNNLLMVVGGQADLLEPGLGGETQRRQLNAIRAAVARGASLTHRLLSFSRRQTLTPQVIDLPQRLEGMSPVLKSTLGEAIALEVQPEPGIWPIEVDANELELAILNLVLNARDAIPDSGKVVVRVRNVASNPATGRRDLVELSIADTGAGMAPEVLAKAFDPFFTTKPAGKGTGLGLSQAHGFALQSGGDITAKSRPGEGCVITLRLPRAAASAADSPPLRAGPARPAPGRVLLVEDNPEVGDVTTALLQRLGREVVSVSTAADALSRLEAGERFDLVLSDIVMPGPVDGAALASRLLAHFPDVPIVLMTGYQEPSRTVPPGVEILRKPFDLQALQDALTDAKAADKALAQSSARTTPPA
jgi:PAS domain S-box-containing protein